MPIPRQEKSARTPGREQGEAPRLAAPRSRNHSVGLPSRLDFAVIVALSLAVLAVYGQVLHHEFVNYDDDQYVYANGRVTQGLTRDGVVWAFSTLSMGN